MANGSLVVFCLLCFCSSFCIEPWNILTFHLVYKKSLDIEKSGRKKKVKNSKDKAKLTDLSLQLENVFLKDFGRNTIISTRLTSESRNQSCFVIKKANIMFSTGSCDGQVIKPCWFNKKMTDLEYLTTVTFLGHAYDTNDVSLTNDR